MFKILFVIAMVAYVFGLLVWFLIGSSSESYYPD
jgi:hypothetical protein